MLDSFLRTYRIARRLYALTGRLSVASVRDQCVRAQVLAERLKAAKGLGPEHTVLVIGEGISAAVAAATFAAQPDGPFVLVVRQENGFANVHQACTYRALEPYLYEWPEGQFRCTSYPLRGSAIVHWHAGTAGEVASGISRDAGRFVDDAVRAGRADFLDGYAANAFRFDAADGQWCVRLRQVRRDEKGRWRVRRGGGTSRDQRAHVVVICGGVHYEQDTFDGGEKGDEGAKFVSRRFWDPDDPLFTEVRRVRKSHGEGPAKPPGPAAGRPRVLLVGGADGVLQDFIYLLTGHENARSALQELALPASPLRDLAERHAIYLRDHAASNVDRDAALFRTIHDEAEWVCDTFWRDPRVRARAQELLLPRPGRPIVQIACRNWYFSHCYPLNRVLAGLVSRAAAADRPAPPEPTPVPFRMNLEVRRITSTAPAGAPLRDADDWAAHPVRVTFARVAPDADVPPVLRDKYSPDGWSPGATYCSDPRPTEFDRVLLRIGAPRFAQVVRACRAADHLLARHRRRDRASPLFDPAAPDTRQREVRHLPPFHP